MTSHIDIRLRVLAKQIAAASVPPAWQATKSAGWLSDVLQEKLDAFQTGAHPPPLLDITLRAGMVFRLSAGYGSDNHTDWELLWPKESGMWQIRCVAMGGDITWTSVGGPGHEHEGCLRDPEIYELVKW